MMGSHAPKCRDSPVQKEDHRSRVVWKYQEFNFIGEITQLRLTVTGRTVYKWGNSSDLFLELDLVYDYTKTCKANIRIYTCVTAKCCGPLTQKLGTSIQLGSLFQKCIAGLALVLCVENSICQPSSSFPSRNK